jgi:hypothetical protein
MSWIEWHLAVNHLPVIGTWVATALLAWGLLVKKEDVRRLALGVLVLVALSALPAYLSGSKAEESAGTLPGVSSADVADHEEAAGVAVGGCVLLGLASSSALLLFRQPRQIPLPWLLGVLAFAILCSAVLAWTAHLGGAIRHPEIRDAGPVLAPGP